MGPICTICGSSEKLILRDNILNMYQCTSCDHAFTLLDEANRIRYSEDYYTQLHSNWFNNPNYWLFDFIYSNIVNFQGQKNVKFLDVGCGKGDLLKYIKERNSKIGLFGIDLSMNCHPGIEFLQGDFLKEKIDMKFDIICSLAAIEHVNDVSAFVRRLDELLLPGGLLIVMTDNTNGIFHRVARVLKRIGISTPFYSLYELAHLNHFTNQSLKKLMQKNGFDIIVQKNHNYPAKAVDLPEVNAITKMIYMLGVRILFSLPKSIGILQTIICKSHAANEK